MANPVLTEGTQAQSHLPDPQRGKPGGGDLMNVYHAGWLCARVPSVSTGFAILGSAFAQMGLKSTPLTL